MPPKPLVRTSTLTLQERSLSENCLGGFEQYLKKKASLPFLNPSLQTQLQNTNISNVEQNLINFFVERGVQNLSFATVSPLIDYLCTDSEPDRDVIVGHIINWFSVGAIHNIPVKKIRGEMTISGKSLLKATMRADPTYLLSEFNDSGPSIDLKPDEIKWLNKLYNRSFSSGKKQACSKCWMCGRDVYVFRLNEKSGDILDLKCGEDEHVFPPGLGNVLGFLYPTYNEQVNTMVDEMTRSGLKSSHAWCNQVKLDLGFILPPYTDKVNGIHYDYRVNETAMRLFERKATDWLDAGFERRKGPDLFHHNMTVQEKKSFVTNDLMPTTRASINRICSELNKVVIPATDLSTSNNIRIIYNLRTIFFGCLLGRALFKDIFVAKLNGWDSFSTPTGGKQIKRIQYGGVAPYKIISDSVDDETVLVNLFLNDSINVNVNVCDNLSTYEVGRYNLRLTPSRLARLEEKMKNNSSRDNVTAQPTQQYQDTQCQNTCSNDDSSCLTKCYEMLFGKTKTDGGRRYTIKKKIRRKYKKSKRNTRR